VNTTTGYSDTTNHVRTLVLRVHLLTGLVT